MEGAADPIVRLSALGIALRRGHSEVHSGADRDGGHDPGPYDPGPAGNAVLRSPRALEGVLSELRAFQARRQADSEAGPGLGDQLRHQG